MSKFYSLIGLLVGLAVVLPGQAQDLGNSPYSKVGIGDFNGDAGNVRNFGMGSLGISMPASYAVNVENPALLVYNGRVVFEMAGIGQFKKVASSSTSQKVSGGNLAYISLSVPIVKKWAAGVGIRPFSSVNYSSSRQTKVTGADVNVLTGNTGSGNLSEVYFSNSVALGKRLSIGVKASYVFGAIDRDAYTILADSAGLSNPQRITINNQRSYSDFLVKGGMFYRNEIKKNLNYNLGAAYSLQSDLNYKSRTLQQRFVSSGQFPDAQTALNDSTNSSITLPSALQVGISFDNNRSWVVGLEYYGRQWSAYKDGNLATNLTNSYKLALSGELTPDATSVDSYFKRVNYRAGATFGNSPITINGQQLDDISVHVGATLPIGAGPRPPEYNQSFVNVGLAVGKLGNTDAGMLRETYVRFMVGVSLNSIWFLKPRFD